MATERFPRRPLSLALRITVLVAMVMTVLFAVFAVLVERSMDMHFAEQDLGEIQAVAESLDAALVPAPAGDDAPALGLRLARAVAGHHGVYFSVHDAAGATLFGTVPHGLYEVARSTPVSIR